MADSDNQSSLTISGDGVDINKSIDAQTMVDVITLVTQAQMRDAQKDTDNIEPRVEEIDSAQTSQSRYRFTGNGSADPIINKFAEEIERLSQNNELRDRVKDVIRDILQSRHYR